MSRDFGWNDGYYTPAPPIAVSGGIKAANARGAFAKNWWGRRWIQALESFRIGARLQRGRSYARSGQVIGLDIGVGRVTDRVQGSRRTPYDVEIRMRPYTDAQWERIAGALAGQPWNLARLLGGEMPEGLEELLAKIGLPLFPTEYGDLVTDCSCPDVSNPCKHIAAVFYIMAEAFDADPFLLLRLRGRDRDALLEYLAPAAAEQEREAPPEPEPLPADAALFWGDAGDGRSAPLPEEPCGLPAAPAPAPAAGRLGPPPFWRGERPFLACMDEICRAAAKRAQE